MKCQESCETKRRTVFRTDVHHSVTVSRRCRATTDSRVNNDRWGRIGSVIRFPFPAPEVTQCCPHSHLGGRHVLESRLDRRCDPCADTP